MERFAEMIGMPLDPWERWLVIHAGEYGPGGAPRWKRLLIIVARQNGKTTLLKILTLFWMYVEQWPMIVGLSTTLTMAKEVWSTAHQFALQHPLLADEAGQFKKDNNDPFWQLTSGSKYRPAASTRKGARSLSVDRLIVDELREHHDWVPYNASVPTMNARPFAQAFFISNQGDDQSVVLNALRKSGIANIDNPIDPVDEELALFEWRAPPGSEMDDPDALCLANPNANHPGRIRLTSLIAQARSLKESGDQEAIAKFKTEILCMKVSALDGAIDPAGWLVGRVAPDPDLLPSLRRRLAMVPELSPDGLSASISVAAALDSGKVRGETLISWTGANAAKALRAALPGWVRKIRPAKLGWIPSGGAAAIAADLHDGKKLTGGDRSLSPVPMKVEAIRAELNAVCMGFSQLVASGQFEHYAVPEQKLLDDQALGAAKLWRGDTWVFSRKGEGHCDALYGVAAAAHLARTMPAHGSGQLRIITAKSENPKIDTTT